MKDIYSNIFSFNKKTLKKSITNLKMGNLVGLPTETVYGLAGNAYSKKSVNKIYKLKKRPKFNPLIVHYLNNKAAENDDDAKSAARAIDLYKADKGITKKKASTSKDAAFATNTKASRSKPQTNDQSSYLRESQVQKMSAQEYEKRQEEIMEAIQTGKFVYDVSGSAR